MIQDQAANPFVQEHSLLVTIAERLIHRLRNMDAALVPVDDVSYVEHHDFVERALSLSLYLDAALQVTAAALYPGSFALIRSALEHQLTDRLLFLANRYQRRLSNITRREWEEFKAKRAAGEPGTQDILDLDWREYRNQQDNGELTIVRSGVHASGEAQVGNRAISYTYYLLYLEGYDPFRGPPDEQAFLQPGFVDAAAHERWAERNRQIYRETKWENLKENLRLNGLNGDQDFIKLDVHYRFLSAFTHPAPAAHDLVYRRNRPSGAPRYDHFASELSLLYIVRLAAAELRDFRAMTNNEPRVEINEWATIDAELNAAEALVAHLWFVGDQPNAYDLFEEANARAFEDENWRPGQPATPPHQIPLEEVRYYRNPLQRLKRLHWSVQEGTTGFAYVSPWPRPDAWR